MSTIAFRPAAIDTTEIARMLGLSRKHVTGYVTKLPDFPEPIVNVSRRTRYWDRGAVLRWAKGTPRRQSRAA